ADDQFDADVESLSDGGFVVSWTDESAAGGNGTDIRFRPFAADGTAVDADRVASPVSGTQNASSVAAIAGGGFIVAYADSSLGGSDLHAQRFDALGNPVGAVVP